MRRHPVLRRVSERSTPAARAADPRGTPAANIRKTRFRNRGRQTPNGPYKYPRRIRKRREWLPASILSVPLDQEGRARRGRPTENTRAALQPKERCEYWSMVNFNLCTDVQRATVSAAHIFLGTGSSCRCFLAACASLQRSLASAGCRTFSCIEVNSCTQS